MSLKFGIYLVEQGIISCDQFCGLVKIQQLSSATMGSIAIRKNVMTIKQVAQILEILELNPGKSFTETATQLDFIDQDDVQLLEREQQLALPSIQKLVTECGLMTERQASVLYRTFERTNGAAPVKQEAPPQSVQQPRQDVLRQPKFIQRPAAATRNQYEATY